MSITIEYKFATLEEVYAAMDFNKPVGFDTETDGLYGKVKLAQFYQKHWPHVLLVRDPNLMHLSAILAISHVLIYHASYDLSTLQRQNMTIMPKRFDDCFLLSRLYYFTALEFSLDDTLRYFLGFSPYATLGIDKGEMQKAKWIGTLSHAQLQYAAIDVFFLPDLYELFKETTEDQSYKLDMLTLKYFIEDLQPTGLPVDSGRRVAMLERNLAVVAKHNLPINVNSYKQVRPYINSVLSDDIGLSTLALQGNTRAAEVKTVRKLLKLNSFLAKFTEDRVYGIFAPAARSGRATCKDQNLQQLPRAAKPLFGVPEDSGRVLIFSDFAQLELRCAAAMVNEPTMVKLIKQNMDMHNYVAEFIFGKDFTKPQRQITKTCNFNLLYGGGAMMLQGILIKQAGVFMEVDEITAIRNKWLKIFPGFAAWHQAGIKAWRAKQPWATPMGRKYVANLMTDQLNICIQGFGAEVAKLALHYMLKDGWFKDNDVKLANFIHDSYIFDAPNDTEVYKEASKRIADSMSMAWQQVSSLVAVKDLPMPVQVFVGYNWGDIEMGETVYAHHI